jgi:hypothetical protein
MIDKGPWGNLRGGGDPEWEPEENDPAKLAATVDRHPGGTTHVPDCDGTAAFVCCRSRDDATAAANSRTDGLSTAGYDYGGNRPLFGSGRYKFPVRRTRK